METLLTLIGWLALAGAVCLLVRGAAYRAKRLIDAANCGYRVGPSRHFRRID